ncbi:hypothetical protein BGZ73_006479 [Actinomortierella ambigua]|nr:hypothetical protein BGZ73_006479 [Actinomortierella ambigua]
MESTTTTTTTTASAAIQDTPDRALRDVPPTAADLRSSKRTGAAYRHTFPVHTNTAPSPLSKEAPPESYRGFVNLGMLLLFGNNVRLMIENYVKYGFLVSFPGSKISRQDWITSAFTHGLLPVNFAIAYLIEEWAMKKAVGLHKRRSEESSSETAAAAAAVIPDDKGSKSTATSGVKAKAAALERLVGWLHVVNILWIITFPSLMAYYIIFHPFMAMGCLMNGLILSLKMTSWVLVNRDLRTAYIFDLEQDQFQHLKKVHDTKTGRAEMVPEVFMYDVQYPNNIRLTNILYFWFAPTLCYQPSYPRTTVFRKSFFAKRVLEMITALGMMYFLIEQYATPTLRNSVKAFDQLEFAVMLERTLKLSTTSVIIWLLMFYTFFHSAFNALAEMLYFGDRCFYLAWWNSGSLATYWRLWNRPVYTFFKRHVYLPLVTKGTSPTLAMFIIFTVSAILHEVLIGLPTHMMLGYAFLGMFAQIPLIAATRPLEKWRGTGTGLGNMIFWVSFTMLGQPAAALLYYYHWTKRNINDSVVPQLI